MLPSDSPPADGVPGDRVARNTGVILWSELVIKLFTLTFTVVFAREYGAPGLGRWTYAWTAATLVMTIAHFGLATLLTREAAARPADVPRLLATFVPARIALACAGLVATIVVAVVTRDPATRTLLLVFAASLVFSYAAELFASVFRARQQLRRVAAINVLDRAVASLAGCAVALAGGSVVATGVAWAAAPALAAAVAVAWVRRAGIRWTLEWNARATARVLRAAAPLYVLAAFGQVYFRQDVVMLRWLTDDATVGHYAAAYRVFEMLLFSPGSLTLAYLPAASAARATSDERFRAVVTRTLRLCFALATPLAVVLAFRATDAVRLFYGADFDPSAPAARILAWTLLFYFPNAVLAHTLISSGRQAVPAASIAAAAVVNVALNLLWIPRFGIEGAAAATLTTEAGLFLAYGRVIARHLLPLRALAGSARPLLAGAACAIACILTHAWPAWAAAPLGILVYGGAAWAMRAIDARDLLALLPSHAAVTRGSRRTDAT